MNSAPVRGSHAPRATRHTMDLSRTLEAQLVGLLELGGVNHGSFHCRLAKFRGLMISGEYGAAIGLK
jgi:hypothetical protein